MRLRIGVLVLAHVPGPTVRRLVIGPLNVRRVGRARVLELAIRNAGNITERLAPGRARRSRCSATDTSSRVCARPAVSSCRTAARSSRRRFRGALRGPATVRVTLGDFSHLYAVRL